MAYKKQNFEDGMTLMAKHLNYMEDNIAALDSNINRMNKVATQNSNGMMSAADKMKLDALTVKAPSVVTLICENESTTITSAYGNELLLKFAFTSTEDNIPTGNGNCKITVNGAVKYNASISQGSKEIDIQKYVTVGSNEVVVICTDTYGASKRISYTVDIIDLKLTTTFNDTVTYTGNIAFPYIPYGAIEKTVHFVIDGSEINTYVTSLSGRQTTETLPDLAHGAHILEVYITATLNDVPLRSPSYTYNLICLDDGDTTPIIASTYKGVTVEQGELVSIPYIVYDPANISCDINLIVYTLEDGEKVEHIKTPITVDRSLQYWNTRKYPIGEVYFQIVYGDYHVEWKNTVSESSINVEPETNGIELILSSNGRSNNEEDPSKWTYNDISTVFTNFNWKSVGWMNDADGDACLRLNGDARAEVQFKPFSSDLRVYGKTIELDFAVRDVNNRDAVLISCMSGGIGFEVKADTAYLATEQSRVFCNYKDEKRIKLTFVIESKNEYRLLSVYLNGVLSDTIQYPSTDNFQQSNPVNISIGSSDCGVDIYNIRSYNVALISQAVVGNFIADIQNFEKKVEVFENNDIYDDYGAISFSKAKQKNSVMVLVGELPKSKGDKKNGIVQYYDIDDSSLDFEDTMVIDVQGTSSQWYVRKNWKLKMESDHYISKDQIATNVICLKVDYAEATGTHNTQNANFVHTLYSEPVPPQEYDDRVRTTIYGKPILLFHKIDESSDPVFYGKANFNFDKGSEAAFGFTEDYDVECWEFCNNTSDACNFLDNIPGSWGDDFEARYPDGYDDISRFKLMHDWVVSTKGDIDKFKREFEDHFDMHYSLIYYVYTFVALMVDQRAKNMFLTYWAVTGKWYPYFYDNDTCFGINNEGQLVFDYYHEDTDTVDGANVYNGQNSTLWNNFRVAFADEIQETYKQLRSDGKITFEAMEKQFIEEGSDKWSESIYNEDTEFKYVSMLKSDNDATNLPQVRGSGEEHLRYFIENRLNYCDSKWYAADYADDYISVRIYTPSTWSGVEPNADITITPYSNMYAGVRYKANGTLYQERATHGVPITFDAPNETFNDTETAVYGASQISSLGDLAPLYCGSVNVAKANKLTELKVGDATNGYVNNNLKELSVGTNKLLKVLDVRNCPALVSPLALTECPNIEEIYAAGSGITGVELPNSGYLKTLQLPATITNLTVKNQPYLTDFSIAGYDAIKTLWIENTPIINSRNIISNATNLERVRLTKVDWTFEDATVLFDLIDMNLAGIDENGNNIDKMWIDGKCHIEDISYDDYLTIKAAYPYLTITSGDRTVRFMNGSTVLQTTTVPFGGIPVYTGAEPAPEEDHVFVGWIPTLGPVYEDTDFRAKFNYTGSYTRAIITGEATTVVLPAVSVYSHAFYQRRNLTTVDLSVATKIGNQSFYGCSELTTLILRSETMCTLADTDALYSTPIESGTGYIYVPDTLVDTYKVNSKWKIFANQIKSISELEV